MCNCTSTAPCFYQRFGGFLPRMHSTARARHLCRTIHICEALRRFTGRLHRLSAFRPGGTFILHHKKGAFTNRYEIFGFKVIESFSNEKNYFVKRNNAIHGIHLVEHIYTHIGWTKVKVFKGTVSPQMCSV
jgi:hypothetical protein